MKHGSDGEKEVMVVPKVLYPQKRKKDSNMPHIRDYNVWLMIVSLESLCSWVLYVNGKEKITDCPSVNDGNWHHIAITWTSTDGAWKVYIDGNLSDGGMGLSVGSRIPGTS